MTKNPCDITIVINSMGGNGEAALSIVDLIKSHKHKVITYGAGRVYSAALFVFLAGNTRYLSPNCSLMLHQSYIAFDNKLSRADFYNYSKKLENYEERVNKLFTQLGCNIKLHPYDCYFTVEEAKKLNMCDDICLLDINETSHSGHNEDDEDEDIEHYRQAHI